MFFPSSVPSSFLRCIPVCLIASWHPFGYSGVFFIKYMPQAGDSPGTGCLNESEILNNSFILLRVANSLLSAGSQNKGGPSTSDDLYSSETDQKPPSF